MTQDASHSLFAKLGFIIRYALVGLGITALVVMVFPDKFNLNYFSSTAQPAMANTQSSTPENHPTYPTNQAMLAAIRPAVVAIQTRSELYPLNSNECRSSLRSVPTSTNACAFLNNGSGVFIDEQGHIVTNAHVIEHAETIIVETISGQKLSATLVGTDLDSDIAIIKVDTKPKAFLALPTTDGAQIGQEVFAIGTPSIAFNQTVTQGIVSAKFFSRVSHYIQTDARLRPGNSGGALVNNEGELLGITSLSSVEQSGDVIYEGFAIAANDVQHIVSQILNAGFVDRGWLGLNGDMTINLRSIVAEMQLNSEQKQALATEVEAIPYGQGIVITAVNEQGPAQLAGLQPLDIILAVNSKAIHNTGDLMAAIWNLPTGAHVSIRYQRQGKEETSTVTLGKRPE